MELEQDNLGSSLTRNAYSYVTYRPNFKMDLMHFDKPRPDLIETSTKIHCISLTTPNGDTSLFAQDDVPMALHHMQNAEMLIGHNILGFDIPAIKKLYPKWRTEAKIRDTLVMSRLAYPNLIDIDYNSQTIPKEAFGSHSLKAWGYRLGYLKGNYG